MFRTDCFNRTIAILLSVLFVLPLFVLASFAGSESVFIKLNVSTESLNTGDLWYDCRALADAADKDVYRMDSVFYLSEDQTILKIEYISDGAAQVELHDRSNDADALYFACLHVMPAFGEALPTSPDGLADGAYWYDKDALAAAYSAYLPQEYMFMYTDALYYLSVDKTILRRTYEMYGTVYNADEIISQEPTPDMMSSYLRQYIYDPNEGFTLLPKSDAGLADGEYWFDAADFAAAFDDPIAAIYLNAEYYLSLDGQILRVSIDGHASDTARDGANADIVFGFLRQAGIDPNAGFEPVAFSPDAVQCSGYYFLADACIDDCIAEINAAREQEGKQPLTQEEETTERAKLREKYASGTIYYNAEKSMIRIRTGGFFFVTYTQDDAEYAAVVFHLQYLESDNHPWDDGVVTTAPTCTKTGVKTYTCPRCGATRTEKVGALGHAWDGGIVTTEPTCTETGVKKYTCANDENHTYIRIIPAAGHDYVESVIAPTCEAEGCTVHTCVRCADRYTTDTVDALGHVWDGGSVTTEPTCTETGVRTYTCTRDKSHTYTEIIPAAGHDYKTVVTAPTCTSEGYTTYTCAACSDSYTADRTEALGHAWDGGSVTTAPTCAETGERTYTCTRDASHTYTEAIPAIGHTYDAVVTAPTCETQGYTTYTCSRCGDRYISDASEALGHAWDGGKVTVAPTCAGTGVRTYTCTRDAGHTYTEDIPAAGHRLGDWRQTKAPTEYDPGEQQRKCSNCDYTEKREIAVLPRTELTLNKTSVPMIYHDSVTLTSSEPVTWSSSNEKVVEVDAATGKLTAVGKGSATITAHSVRGGKTATCTVTVKYSFVQILIRIFLLGFLWY